jgi:DNA-binding response OmpR family regulator
VPRPTILIIEDHTMIAEYIASVVEGAGFEPIQARSLAEARSRLAERRFDLWLCDRNLPDGDATALLSERDRDDRHRDTPAIALTAELTASGRRTLLSAGFDEALAKPCTPGALLVAIGTVISALPGSAGLDRHEAVDANACAGCNPVLDDAAALAVCGGDRATLSAMRRLLAGEVPGLVTRLRQLIADDDRRELGSELHRLIAAAAWCGAAEVAALAGRLQSALGTADVALIRAGGLALDDALARLSRALCRLD